MYSGVQGFVASKEITLSNTSEIPMTFDLRVPDGSATDTSSNNDKEFTIVPQHGTLPPNFQQVIKVGWILI